ncbi:MAG: hypothetical protein AAF519_06275 [Bacteroidota bacterium]
MPVDLKEYAFGDIRILADQVEQIDDNIIMMYTAASGHKATLDLFTKRQQRQ